ncbi:MAG: 3-isopropylmalate dehydratase small subunit [Kiritimatiellae bacterium]|nr:3-isopropylmalate dehydratase small subunit [Kiritimatiellia bacterium]
MQPFTTHTGIVATLDRANVDTDQIIPKQFLKSIRRTGFESGLFFDWRFRPDGSLEPGFELNAPALKGASVLVTRNNFGCGSSREHAVWAIQQYGFRAVVAPWADRDGTRVPAFADIFRNNAGKNGLLTIELTPGEVDRIFASARRHPGVRADVDLSAQTLTVHSAPPETFRFDVDPSLKDKLLNGVDDISATLAYEDRITEFERTHDVQRA